MRCDLVVLQQDEAEVELAEGQLQVLDVAVFAALLLGQVEDGAAASPQARGSTAFALGVQRRLQLILQRGEASLSFGQFLCTRADVKTKKCKITFGKERRTDELDAECKN